jgi:hypothetical protein
MAIYVGKRKQRKAIPVFVIDAIDNVDSLKCSGPD